MNKLNLRISALVLLSVFTLSVFNACKKDEKMTAENNTVVVDDNPFLVATDLLNMPITTINEFENDLAVVNDGFPEELTEENVADFRNNKGDLKSLNRCLKDLNLSLEQKAVINGLNKELFKCRTVVMFSIRRINIDITKHFNTQRALLINKFKNNEITKEELTLAMKRLEANYKNAMKNNPRKAELMLRLENCHKHYIQAMQRTLTPAQWQAVVRCLKANSGDKPGDKPGDKKPGDKPTKG